MRRKVLFALKINMNVSSGFALLDNYAYSTHARWAQANISWYTPYLLLKHLPFLKKKRYDEALHLRSLIVYKQLLYLYLC